MPSSSPRPWLSADRATMQLISRWHSIPPALRDKGYTYADVMHRIEGTATFAPIPPYSPRFCAAAVTAMQVLGFPGVPAWERDLLPVGVEVGDPIRELADDREAEVGVLRRVWEWHEGWG
ncbi:hypothetical protein MMC13_004920 [Lambiella insularis]|nr:hypothetical protein [Lambiella insularis]